MKLLLVYRRSIIFKDEEESNEESSSPGSYVLSIRNWINILLGYAPGTKEKRRGIFISIQIHWIELEINFTSFLIFASKSNPLDDKEFYQC